MTSNVPAIQSALDQIGEQGLDRSSGLGRALASASKCLCPRSSTPTGAGTTCLPKCTPSINKHQLKPAQLAANQFSKLALGAVYEALADRALAGAPCCDHPGRGSSESA